jgi:hypothetical protein
MLGLFNKKKEHLSKADLVALMLSFQQEMVTVLSRDAQNLFQPKIDSKILQFECEVLSLCILSLAIQDNDLDLRNTIYFEYCRYMNFDKDTTKRFLEHLDMRCTRYYDAFNSYAKDHRAGGCMLGSVVANGLKGVENDKLELDAVKVYVAFSLFINSLKSTFEFIGDLKKKYDLSEVNSVFVE